MPFIFIAVFAVVGALAIRMAVVQSRQAAANLLGLARRLGWDYDEKSLPSLRSTRAVAGTQDGRGVRFHEFTTGSGKSRRTWRAVSVSPAKPGPLTFNLHRQGLFSKVQALLGAKEATVGDAAFDAAWFLQTNDPEFLGAALVPEVRSKLMAALAAGGQSISFRLEKGVVRYAEVGSFSSEPAGRLLEAMLPVLHDLADMAEVAAERAPPPKA